MLLTSILNACVAANGTPWFPASVTVTEKLKSLSLSISGGAPVILFPLILSQVGNHLMRVSNYHQDLHHHIQKDIHMESLHFLSGS